MNISSINSSSFQKIADLNTSTTEGASAPKVSANTEATTLSNVRNTSNLSAAVRQALTQINSGKDLTAFLSSDSSQQAASDFTSNLFSNLPGLASGNNTNSFNNTKLNGAVNQAPKPVALDESSTSFKLQSSIQKLITQLDSSSQENEDSGLGNLQASFNTLISKSGGEPSAQNLQSFLKLVEVNIRGSTSIGSLFSTSA